eukprot:11194794-Lingulodinium_polyedra.AAC.1
MLEADELVAKNRKPKDSTDELHVHLMNVSEKTEPEIIRIERFASTTKRTGSADMRINASTPMSKGPKRSQRSRMETESDKGGENNIRGICKYLPT